MIGLIAAVSQNWVIGRDQKIPWNYPEDMKFFRTNTKDAVVIMGKNTFISLGEKPLPKRRNIVVSKSLSDGYICRSGIETYSSLLKAIEQVKLDGETNIWLIGGEQIYQNGFKFADMILLTEIPETIEGENLTYFPNIDKKQFALEGKLPLYNADGKQTLQVAKYIKIKEV